LKHFQIIIIVLCTFIFCKDTFTQQRSSELGAIFGEPTGISAKIWTSPTDAIDFGFGWSIGGDRINMPNDRYNGDSRIHFHFDYLLHVFNVIGLPEQYPIYYGIGARFNTGGGYYNSLAVRFIAGFVWMPSQSPISLFFEIAPSLQLTSEPGFAIDSGLGTRFCF